MEKIKCAVLGATGVVGQHFLKLLADHPDFEVAKICASDARAGKKLAEIVEVVPGGIPARLSGLVFDPLEVDPLVSSGIKVAFSALPSDVAGTIEKEAASRGIKIFSNAGAFRMEEKVPILIPEINHHQLDIVKQQGTDGYIVTNANCTTTGLTMALLPIHSLGIKRLIVASYQAISGAGYPGIPAMDINANVIPYIKNEEPKVRKECTKIFGTFDGSAIVCPDWEIHAHCIRVPTLIGHLISVHVELESEMSFDKVKARFEQYEPPAEVTGLPTAPLKPVYFTENPTRPQPRLDQDLGEPERARGMAVIVGRLEVEKNIVRFVTLSNNLVRGAAGGSVLNAELALRRGMI